MTIRFTQSYQGWIVAGFHQPGDTLDVDAPTAAYLCDRMDRAVRVDPKANVLPKPEKLPTIPQPKPSTRKPTKRKPRAKK